MSAKRPPDGGWGWIIAIAHALNGLSTYPIMQGFGLVFKDSFDELNLTATDTSVILNVNFAFGMVFALFNGPILKKFGYRKMAILGSITYTFGITLTAYANSFPLIIFSYGILASIGMTMSISAFSLALNTYFSEKRNRAVGMAMAISGLGSIFMPQITSLSLSSYGSQGTILLYGAYSLLSLIASFLLQPIELHMKSAPTHDNKSSEIDNKNPEVSVINREETPNCKAEENTNIYSSKESVNIHQRTKKALTSNMMIDHDADIAASIYADTVSPSTTSTDIGLSLFSVKNMEMTEKINLDDNLQYLKRRNSATNLDSINLGSSLNIFDEFAPTTKDNLTFVDDNDCTIYQNVAEKNAVLQKEADKDSTQENYNNGKSKEKSVFHRIVRRLCDLYDLDLLRDPTYVNIIVGISIGVLADVNFSMLTPFILADMNIKTAKIATIMSVIAVVDLITKCAAPFIREWLHQPSRIIYLIGLGLLIICRTSLIFTKSFTSLIIFAIGLGFARGIRSVYIVLVVPDYVPNEKLANATGIEMMVNGILVMLAGPMFGVIRDNTENYNVCIILINCVTTFTILLWVTEIIILRRKSMRQRNVKSHDNATS